MISAGISLISATTVAPKPRLTSKMGKAQQNSVPVDVNSVSQLKPVILSCLFVSFIKKHRHELTWI